MANGHAELDAMIRRIRALPAQLRAATPEIAVAVEHEIERTIAAATTPEGQAWAPKKVGAGAPLATAAKALRVAPIGSTIFARLTGHIARHNKGWAKGGVQRRILPAAGIPAPMASAIKRVLTRRFEGAMRP